MYVIFLMLFALNLSLQAVRKYLRSWHAETCFVFHSGLCMNQAFVARMSEVVMSALAGKLQLLRRYWPPVLALSAFQNIIPLSLRLLIDFQPNNPSLTMVAGNYVPLHLQVVLESSFLDVYDSMVLSHSQKHLISTYGLTFGCNEVCFNRTFDIFSSKMSKSPTGNNYLALRHETFSGVSAPLCIGRADMSTIPYCLAQYKQSWSSFISSEQCKQSKELGSTLLLLSFILWSHPCLWQAFTAWKTLHKSRRYFNGNE